MSSPTASASRPRSAAGRWLALGFNANCLRNAAEYRHENPIEPPVDLELTRHLGGSLSCATSRWACRLAAPRGQRDCRPAVSLGPWGNTSKTLSLSPGLTLKLVRIPAGEFVMGDLEGEPDEPPLSRVTMARPFWMARCEISTEQSRQFNSTHDSRYYQKRYPALEPGAPGWVGPDARGVTLNGDSQPVVRVSWDEAMAFCRWLSARAGLRFNLPTEGQWEWACRACTSTPFSFGARDADFSPWANLADASFSKGLGKDGKQITGTNAPQRITRIVHTRTNQQNFANRCIRHLKLVSSLTMSSKAEKV